MGQHRPFSTLAAFCERTTLRKRLLPSSPPGLPLRATEPPSTCETAPQSTLICLLLTGSGVALWAHWETIVGRLTLEAAAPSSLGSVLHKSGKRLSPVRPASARSPSVLTVDIKQPAAPCSCHQPFLPHHSGLLFELEVICVLNTMAREKVRQWLEFTKI